ncbi:MAG: 2-amino-4-hydroxy-6-hydroxymethyldihydropteridine diphosphokinase [Gammaproteobacteria bacterium]|nr:MAG: 2-amino-4-hydroxy-6-hydroxymethyldihydropteridine diphosphokinase [Gammaproteobacteria bacterium]
MAIAYIGMGSNLAQPVMQLFQARQKLQQLAGCRVLADSGLFASKAMTLPGDERAQPDYMNAVVKLETELAPLALLDQLQAIELEQGRERTERWGPRTLDLDVLLYDQLQLDQPRLRLPHPGIAQRSFVLYPLQNIDPGLHIPGQGDIAELINQVSDQGLQYLGTFEQVMKQYGYNHE